LENLGLVNYINIITSEESLKDFLRAKENIKIWLQDNHNLPETVHEKLRYIITKLDDLNIKFGYVLKSVSPDFKLCIEVKGEVVQYIETEDILYILGIIGATLGVGNNNEILFHSMHAGLYNLKLPLISINEMFIINDFIKTMMDFKNFIIPNSSLMTLNLLRKNDNRWKFFIPIDAEQTSSQSIVNLAKFVNLEIFKEIEWVVGGLDISEILATGYLFIIKNSKVMAICLDELDMKLMSKTFNSQSNDFINLLAPKRIEYSFYPERAKSAEIIIKYIEHDSHEILNITDYGLKSFEGTQDGNLNQSSVQYQILHNGMFGITYAFEILV